MKLRYLTEEAYNALYDNVEANKVFYLKDKAWLKEFFGGKEYFVETKIECPKISFVVTENKLSDDFTNAVEMYNTLGKILTPKQATNKYMWTYLTHESFWEYSRKRWPIENKASIETRYFCGESRNPLTRNALSRLWWYSFLTVDDESVTDRYRYLKILLNDTDLCMNLVERKLSMNRNILIGILQGIDRYYSEYPESEQRKKREVIKYINRFGAVSILEFYSRDEIAEKVYAYLKG